MSPHPGELAQQALRRTWVPWALLAVALAAHLFFSLVGADPFKLIDLRVYVDGARHLGDGQLYDFLSGEERLPFTYPPFAAIVFWPLSVLPWPVVAVGWQLGCVAALAAIIHLSLRLIRPEGPAGVQWPIIVSGTAIGMWLEPVRSTFNYGQINLFLVLIVLAGAVTTKHWWAGATVGLAAGIKLTPAITGLYYLLARRYSAVVWSVVVFAGTIALAAALLGEQVWRYFTELIFAPERTGAVWVTRNQGWRGALFRLFGTDLVWLWAIIAALCVALGVWACLVALRAGDRAAAFLAVQFVGLLVSPISWSHHWVWMVPLVLWCAGGRYRHHRPVRILGWSWLAACLLMVVPILIAIQGLHLSDEAVRPLWESLLDAIYPVLGTLTLLVIARLPGRGATPTS